MTNQPDKPDEQTALDALDAALDAAEKQDAPLIVTSENIVILHLPDADSALIGQIIRRLLALPESTEETDTK